MAEYVNEDELRQETISFIKKQKYKLLTKELKRSDISESRKLEIEEELKLGEWYWKYVYGNRLLVKLSKKYSEQPTNSHLLKRITQLTELLAYIEDNADSYYNYSNYNTDRWGKMIHLMIINIRKKPNFSGYSYGDEFYIYAIENIIKYIHNYKPHKAKAFNYISTYIHNAFVAVINKEKEKIEEMKKEIDYSTLDKYSTKTNNLKVPNKSTYMNDLNIVDVELISNSKFIGNDGKEYDLGKTNTPIFDIVHWASVNGVNALHIVYFKDYVLTAEERQKVSDNFDFEYLNIHPKYDKEEKQLQSKYKQNKSRRKRTTLDDFCEEE